MFKRIEMKKDLQTKGDGLMIYFTKKEKELYKWKAGDVKEIEVKDD